ncbi:hypothetical protein [Roseateles aquatilis]|uniref:hypothetical protein n=1 Tax=Roseateles aquatilis TaxID=431061 RepID=UPI0011315DAA|nr:hypothetical protein [Roseateles aquatilis]
MEQPLLALPERFTALFAALEVEALMHRLSGLERHHRALPQSRPHVLQLHLMHQGDGRAGTPRAVVAEDRHAAILAAGQSLVPGTEASRHAVKEGGGTIRARVGLMHAKQLRRHHARPMRQIDCISQLPSSQGTSVR